MTSAVTSMVQRAMVFTIPERGHFNPLLGPAAALERQGVEVVWGVAADIREELRHVGAQQVLTPDDAAPPSPSLRGAALSEIIADPPALRSWIRALLVDAQPQLVEPFRRMIREVRPQVVAIDTMVYAAAIAAELEGVPWVGWSTSLNPVIPTTMRSELIDTLAALDADRHALFTDHGLTARFRVSDVLSPWGTAVFTTSALVPAVDDPTVYCVGPSVGGRRTGELPTVVGQTEGPLIYASFGSQAWHQPAWFERVIDAAIELGVTLVASMGDLAQGFSRRSLPPTICCAPFVDQVGVLARADAIVTHAGANSVMESLAAGVPSLLAPICNDQPHNRQIVEGSGAGVGIDLDTATTVEVCEVLAQLLAEGPPRVAAREISASYRAHDGAQGAAALALRAVR